MKADTIFFPIVKWAHILVNLFSISAPALICYVENAAYETGLRSNTFLCKTSIVRANYVTIY